jgi:hypothetical protein
VEQELLTLLEYLSSPPGFSGVCVTRSLVLYVCFVDRYLSFCTFSCGDRKIFEVMTSTLPKGIIGSVASLLAATLYQGNPDNICVTNDHGYVPLVVNTSRSFPHSRLINGFVTRLTRQVPLVEQELLTLPEHMSSPRFFVGVLLLPLC